VSSYFRCFAKILTLTSFTSDTLEHLSLDGISLAAYPEVADIRFPRLKSLELSFCHPYSVSQLPCFYSHFPSLKALAIDNDNIDRALIDA